MSQIIKIQIIDKIATCLTELPIVCGNSDYVAEFHFDEEWNTHPVKTARFKVNGEYTDVVFEGNECSMPIILNSKVVWIGVYAGDLSTSTPALVRCKPGILDGEDVPAPPREDVYSQIIKLCEGAVSKAESVEERANNGEFGGATTQIIDSDITLNIEDNETGTFSLTRTGDWQDEVSFNIFYEYETTDGGSVAEYSMFYIPEGESEYWSALNYIGNIIGEPSISFSSNQDNPNIQFIDGKHLRYYEEQVIVEAAKVITDYVIAEKITVGGESVALVGQLNDVERIAKGAQQAISFRDYRTFINKFNDAKIGDYPVGQSIMIVTLNVPDLWVSATYNAYKKYTYDSDEKFVEELITNGQVQVGRYTISALETQKVNLAGYVERLTSTENNLVYVERSNGRGVIGYKLAQQAIAYGVPERDKNGDINVPEMPSSASSATSKKYVDGLVGDIETALDSIIAMQEILIGGET